MSNLVRTFIAVDIKPGKELLGVTGKLKKLSAGEAVKWTDAGNMHLTLKFLGDIKPESINEIVSVLSDIIKEYRVFSFGLNGVGFFKSGEVPRVIFAKVTGEDILQKLAEEIDMRLSETGFEREMRPFSPHLTLARVKYLNNRSAFSGLIHEYDNYYFQSVFVKEIILYRSILTSHGPHYKKLAVIGLK
jgi:RNA 2',3'-cyclic 3'-phosphodiesterase